MVELSLFGFVIQHIGDQCLPATFTIHEILGAQHEDEIAGVILMPNEQLLAMIENPLEGTITEKMLRLQPTGNVIVTPDKQFGGDPMRFPFEHEDVQHKHLVYDPMSSMKS